MLAHHVDVVESALADREGRWRRRRCRACRVPSSGRFRACAALTVGPRSRRSAACPGTGTSTASSTWSKAGPLMQSAWCTSDGDRVGQEAVGQHGARAVLKANEPLPWPMSNLTPRFRGLRAPRCFTVPWWVAGELGNRAEGVGQNIARPQTARAPPRSSAAGSRCGTSAACPPRCATSQRRCRAALMPELPDGAAPDTHLDADDDVAVGVGDRHRVDRVHQAQLLARAPPSPGRRRRRCRRGETCR